MPVTQSRAKVFAITVALAVFLLVVSACGSVDVTVDRTTSTPAPDPTPTSAPADTPAPTSAPADTSSPTEPPPAEPGSYEGVTYVVGEGSEATFTVEEKLSSLPLPNDAVVRTTALSGEVHFDGRPSSYRNPTPRARKRPVSPRPLHPGEDVPQRPHRHLHPPRLPSPPRRLLRRQ